MANERSHRRVFSGRVDRRNGPTRDTVIQAQRSSDHHTRINSRPPPSTSQRLPRQSAAGITTTTDYTHSDRIATEQSETQYYPAGGFQTIDVVSTNRASAFTFASNPENTRPATVLTTLGNRAVISDERSEVNHQQGTEANVITNEASNETDIRTSDRVAYSCSDRYGNQGEINNFTQNGIILTPQSTNLSSSFAPPSTVIPDAVSGYTITELPRPVDSSRNQPIIMMDESPDTIVPDGCIAMDNLQCYGQSQGINDIIDCLPPPFYYPPPSSRGRRHRQRRRRRRRSHRRNRVRRQATAPDDDRYIKPRCCSILGCKICLAMCLQFKRVLVFFASFGIICVLIGIVLGVLRAPGNSFFTLSLMFVGLGLILLTMVLVGWKCTPSDHEPCHMLFGLGVYCSQTRRDRRRRERLYWFGSRLYPEFRYRAPPPSYAATMQEFRSEIRHLESIPYVPGSPPPSYKSHTTIERPGIHIIFPRNDEFPNSNPPTYRLRTQPNRPSLAILNDSTITSAPEPLNRFSVTSTDGLVESEVHNETHNPGGIVNLSFNGSDRNLESSNRGEAESNFSTSACSTVTRTTPTDGNICRLTDSVVITLEPGVDGASNL